MSIIWLEPFTFFKPDSGLFNFQNLDAIIYLNMISCVCFLIYSLLYKIDDSMQKPPNTLIILKMFGECMISLNLLILFLFFSFQNNKRKIEKANFVIYILSLLSPSFVFLTYFFNACVAHNLFQTFWAYKNSYYKRLAMYKIIAAVGFVSLIFLSLLFNDKQVDKKFTLSYYYHFFLAAFYIMGLFVLLYIIYTIFYVFSKKQDLFSYREGNDSMNQMKEKLVNKFINRTLLFLIIFVVCYAPNNIIILLQIFMPNRMCDLCPFLSIACFLVSLSCTLSFALKFSEPYMRKYIKHITRFIFKDDGKTTDERSEDYTRVYDNLENKEVHHEANYFDESKNKDHLLQEENPKELVDLIKLKERRAFKQNSFNQMGMIINIYDEVNRSMECSDHISRLIGMCLTLNKETEGDFTQNFSARSSQAVPWEMVDYKDKTNKEPFTYKDFPDFLPKDEDKYKKFKVSIRKYCKYVFYHIRKIDGVSNRELINSLHPSKNIEKIKESLASGGRSQNPILFTFDKKFLIKTISKDEKNIFMKMLPEYHRKMKESKSLLCRIYGLFRIMVNEKETAHIIIMKNMCELPNETKYLTFDMKGSSFERDGLREEERIMAKNGREEEVIKNNTKTILKDNDFATLNIKFRLTPKDADNLNSWVNSDCELLRSNGITDYSLLATIHTYTKETYEKNIINYRVFKSFDNKFIYNFSLIDFFCVYDIVKKAELRYKEGLRGQENISVQKPVDYYRRIVKHVRNCIEEEKNN